MQFVQLRRGDLVQQTRELVLPLLAVAEDRKLQRRAVEQHKLDVQDRLLDLHVVRDLRVSVKRRVSKSQYYGRRIDSMFFRSQYKQCGYINRMIEHKQ